MNLNLEVELMTTATPWHMQGDILEMCSCNTVCPCNYGGDPSDLPCEAVLCLRIDQGNYGSTGLSGLNVVLYFQIPGKPFEGNWTLGVYLDQQASQTQAEAIGNILSGQAGGWFEPFSGLIGNAIPPKVVPIKFETVDGEHRVTIDGVLEAASEKIPHPMPGAGNLDTTVSGMAVPFFTGPVSVRRSSTLKLTDPDLSFEYSGKSANLARFEYSGP